MRFPTGFQDLRALGSAPANPAAGDVRLYALTDGRGYARDSSGNVMRLDNTVQLVFGIPAALSVRVGVARLPIMFPGVIEAVAAMVNTVPTGAAVIIDVNKGGTTIYGTQANRPTIAISANAATVGAHSVTTVAAGDYLTADVDQVGSTIAGSDLTLAVLLRRTG